MPDRLTDDRLREFRDDEYVCVTDGVRSMAAELLELRQRTARYRDSLEELAKGGCIRGHPRLHCWDCYKQVRDWCHKCVAQYALDPWTGREAQA